MTLYLFGILHISQANLFTGSFELTIAIVITINLLAFIANPKYEPYSTVVMTAMILAYIMLIFTGGVDNTGIIWIHTFPVVAFALKRRRIGGTWLVGFIFLLASITIIQVFGLFQTAYSFVELRQNIISVAVVALLVYFFALYLEQRENIFIEQDKELAKLNKRLGKSLTSVKKERAKVTAFLSSIGNGIVATDARGKTVLANPSALSLLNLKKSELINKSFFHTVPLVDKTGKKYTHQKRPGVQALMARNAMTVSSPPNLPHYFKLPNGTSMPIAIAASPILLEDRTDGAMISFREVSKEVKLSEEKTEFVSIASHQLRTPLTGLKWTLELLEQERISKSAKEAMREATSSIDTMIKLVSDLLNVSRIEVGSIAFNPKPSNVVNLIETIIKEVQPLAAKKNLLINFEKPSKKLPSFTIDPDLYRQVLHNLLTNAIKYSTTKSSNVIVSLDPDNNKIITKVQDFGMGIKLDQQKKVFTKFFRSEKAKKSVLQVADLDCILQKWPLIRWGGDISFTSKEGKGSEFILELPISPKQKKEA